MQETNFFGFLIFNSKQNKTKEIGTERLPFPVASKSPATAPENLWCLVDGRVFGGGDDDDDDYFPGNGARKSTWWLRVGEPQEEGYNVDSSKFSLE